MSPYLVSESRIVAAGKLLLDRLLRGERIGCGVEMIPTSIVDGRDPRVHFASPGPDRWKERSRTLPGIAAAMAEQWG